MKKFNWPPLSILDLAALAVFLGGMATTVAAGQATPSPGSLGPAPRYQSPIAVQPAAPSVTLPVPPAFTPNATVVEDVIVRVNDQIINRSDVQHSQQQLDQELLQNKVPADIAAQRQKDMLRDMIDQQLLLSRGKELGINADAEVTRRLNEIRKQNNLATMEDLEREARKQGISFEDFKAQIRNSVITQQVVRDEVGRNLRMSQAQEQTYYDAHKSEMEQPEQVRLSEILIPTAADPTDAQIAAAKTKAEDIAAKIKAGAKFEDVAKTYSGGQTAAQGGDLGLFKRGALAKVLEDQTFGLAPGESTAPIRTRQGFVLLKVTDHVAAGVPPMKDVEQQIQEALYMEQMQPALRTYLTKLREDAYVDVRTGFVDSGASPKQTKPVNTAYAPPTVKKKTIEKKKRLESNSGVFAPAAVGSQSARNDASAAPPVTTPGVSTGAPVTGGESSSSAPAAPTPVAGGRLAQASLTRSGKPKKVHREKVRFGQAPRNSLPAGPEDVATVGADTGTNVQGGGLVDTGSVAGDDNPLAPRAPVLQKTRFSARAETEPKKKAAVLTAKKKEKLAATPVAMSADEKATAKAQAAPLGLNGDTAKKPKTKVKKVKGAPKERLEQKEKVAPVVAPPPSPTVSPSLAPTNIPDKEPASSTEKTSDRTTLPPPTEPAGAPPAGKPVVNPPQN